MKDNFHVDTLIKAAKRHKAQEVRYKLTLTCDDLTQMRRLVNIDKVQDAQLWSIILASYFGLLRISNVTVPSKQGWDPLKTLSRQDIAFHKTGCVLTIKWAKNLQLRERSFHVALPKLDNCLCPTAALINFLRLAGDVPASAPAWAISLPSGVVDPPTPATIRPRLQALVAAIGKPPQDYNTHSLRRSGASHLLSLGVPVETIKVLGDWKSHAVVAYLKPQPCQRLAMANDFFSEGRG